MSKLNQPPRSPEMATTKEMELDTLQLEPANPLCGNAASTQGGAMGYTLEPFSLPSSHSATKPKRKLRKVKVDGSSWTPLSLEETFPTLQPSPTAYFLIKPATGPFGVRDFPAVLKDLSARARVRREDITDLRDGSLLIHSHSREQSALLSELITVNGSSVSSGLDPKLNTCQGTIFAPKLLTLSEAEILEAFKDFGVSRVHRFLNHDSDKTPTPRLLLTFNHLTPPEKVWYAWVPCDVRLYIPSPMMCYTCLRFGHTAKFCRQTVKLCTNCSQADHGQSFCPNSPCCAHCGNSHSAKSTSCRVYKFEREVIALKTKERLTYPQARAKVLSRFAEGNVTFAETLKGVRPPSRSNQAQDQSSRPEQGQLAEAEGTTISAPQQRTPERKGKRKSPASPKIPSPTSVSVALSPKGQRTTRTPKRANTARTMGPPTVHNKFGELADHVNDEKMEVIEAVASDICHDTTDRAEPVTPQALPLIHLDVGGAVEPGLAAEAVLRPATPSSTLKAPKVNEEVADKKQKRAPAPEKSSPAPKQSADTKSALPKVLPTSTGTKPKSHPRPWEPPHSRSGNRSNKPVVQRNHSLTPTEKAT